MRRSWASVTVGALIVVIAAISYFLIWMTSERPAGSQGYSVSGLFHDASGLFEKSRVQTAGISVGQIESRELEGDTAKARITIRVLPKITLYENAVISKKAASLLGEYHLEIDPGTPFAEVRGEKRPMRVLKDGDRITRKESDDHRPAAVHAHVRKARRSRRGPLWNQGVDRRPGRRSVPPE